MKGLFIILKIIENLYTNVVGILCALLIYGGRAKMPIENM